MQSLPMILAAIARVAPDVDTASLPLDVDFREEAELDSMDFLAVLNAVRDSTGVEVPEADYGALTTLRRFAEYVDGRLVTDHPGV